MRRPLYDYADPTLPIQIRPDLVVRIHPMPHDLTQAEADKICRVVQAMVLPASGMSPGTAETGTGSGPKDGQPDPKGDAQKGPR